MNLKSLSPICAGVALAMGFTSTFAKSSVAANQTIFCENSNGVLTTMARTVEGQNLPIFHWRAENLPKDSNLQQICHSVSTKLDNYLAQGSVLSSFGSYDQLGLPAICAEAQPNQCSLVLLTLAPTQDPINKSNRLLDNILDEQLKQEKRISSNRGVQYFGYNITGTTFLKLLFKTL